MADAISATEEMIKIIHRNFESKNLDYKGPVSWDSQDKKACCELVKDILSMANTEGGHIVIGVSESSEGFRLDGMTLEQVKTFESSEICRFVQKYADPPINVRVQKVTHQDLLFILLEVPRFFDTPHICQKDFQGVLRDRELYVRTDNNESAPIKSSSDFRALIEAAIRNRTDSLLSSFRSILTGANSPVSSSPDADDQFTEQIVRAQLAFEERNPLKEDDYSYFIETIFRPEEFDQYRFPSDRLQARAQHAAASYLDWPFVFYHFNRLDLLKSTDDGLETLIHTKDFANVDILDFWRFNESGLFYKRALTPTSHTSPPVAHAARIIWQFTEAILCITRLYDTLLPDSESISLLVTFFGTRKRALTWPEIGMYPGRFQANRPTIEIRNSFPLAEWKAGIEDHALGFSQKVFQQFQLENPDEVRIREQIQKIIRREL